MPFTAQMSRLVLGIVALALPLCPCGAMNKGIPGSGQISSVTVEAGSHDHHMADQSRGQPAAESPPCHGPDTPTDCGMSDSADVVSRWLSEVNAQELPTALEAKALLIAAPRTSTFRAAHPPPRRHVLPVSTPVMRWERLLT